MKLGDSLETEKITEWSKSKKQMRDIPLWLFSMRRAEEILQFP